MIQFTDNESIKAYLYLHSPIKSEDEAKTVINTLESLRPQWTNLMNPFYEDVYSQIFITYGEACMKLKDYAGAIKILEEGRKALEGPDLKYKFLPKYVIHDLLVRCYAALDKHQEAYASALEMVFNQLYPFNNQHFDNYEFYGFRAVSEYSLNDLKNGTLSMCSPDQFNDPVDTPLFGWMYYRNEYLRPKSQEEARYLDIIEQAYANIRVRCLVRNIAVPYKEGRDLPIPMDFQREYANTLMWSHYADFHKGFCVKYVLPSSFTSSDPDEDHVLMLRPISYVDSFSILDDFGTPRDITYIEALLTKQKQWEYEHEHRLIYFNRKGSPDFPTPRLPEGSVKAVYLGVRMPDESRRQILDILKDKPEIEIYQMSISSEDLYRLTARRINADGTPFENQETAHIPDEGN